MAVRELTGGLIGVCDGAGWRIGKDLGRGSVNRTIREWYRNSNAEQIAAVSSTGSERNCRVVPM